MRETFYKAADFIEGIYGQHMRTEGGHLVVHPHLTGPWGFAGGFQLYEVHRAT